MVEIVTWDFQINEFGSEIEKLVFRITKPFRNFIYFFHIV